MCEMHRAAPEFAGIAPVRVRARLSCRGLYEGITMIRHIVFFNARDPADRDRIFDGLALLTQTPHASVIEVARNQKIDQLSNAVDIVVYAEFADDAALAAFKADPVYQRSIEQVRPLRELRMAADYDNSTAAKSATPVSNL